MGVNARECTPRPRHRPMPSAVTVGDGPRTLRATVSSTKWAGSPGDCDADRVSGGRILHFEELATGLGDDGASGGANAVSVGVVDLSRDEDQRRRVNRMT